MRELRSHPDLEQLRRQARELLRDARTGQAQAVERLARAEARLTLSGAQLAVAREYGFTSWAKLKTEVERRRSNELAFLIRRVRSVEELRSQWSVVHAALGISDPLDRPHWHVFDDFETKRALSLVVEHDGRPVGGTIEWHLIALEGWARGRGLGTRLVQTVEVELLTLGRTLGWHADPENKGFFQRLGYSDRGKSRQHMYKGAPVSPRLLERRLSRWRARAGDLDAGVVVSVDHRTGRVPGLPW